ncbi:MAG: DUF6492 family protein [Candidatus Omnitrophota bacterium]
MTDISGKETGLFRQVIRISKRNILFWFKRLKGRSDVNLKKVVPSSIKLDVLIPVVEKDLDVLPYAIDGARKNIKHPLGEIIIVAPDSGKIKTLCEMKGCRFVNEDTVLPITKSDVKFERKGINLSGWLFQQLLKLSGDTICSQKYYLVLDADTVLLRPQVFLHSGKTLFNYSDEYRKDYFVTYENLLGEKPVSAVSFISHYMLFEKEKVQKLKEAIETRSGMKWYDAVIREAGAGDASFSEYETYANFALSRFPGEATVNYWFNFSLFREALPEMERVIQTLSRRYKSASFHSSNSKNCFKGIYPEECRPRIEARMKDRREKGEIPATLPERPKVFIAVRQVNWEKTGLVDSWRELADVVHYDWNEQYGRYNNRDWQRTGKYLFNEELIERVKKEHAKKPIDIFFSYLSGRTAFFRTVKKISDMGIIAVNIGFDDTLSFQGKKKNTGWTGNTEIALSFDACITCQNRSDIVRYLKIGANPIFFPPGGNHRFWASRPPAPERKIPVSFIGQNYGRRERVVNRLRKAGIQVATYGKGWPEGGISQEKMREVYNNSLVTLGFGYIGKTNLVGLKGRDFEVPLTGTAYLTTCHEELARCFEPDREMFFYSNEEELIRKVKYCLDNPEMTKEVGLAGRKKALAEQTWEKRWQEVLEMCR